MSDDKHKLQELYEFNFITEEEYQRRLVSLDITSPLPVVDICRNCNQSIPWNASDITACPLSGGNSHVPFLVHEEIVTWEKAEIQIKKAYELSTKCMGHEDPRIVTGGEQLKIQLDDVNGKVKELLVCMREIQGVPLSQVRELAEGIRAWMIRMDNLLELMDNNPLGVEVALKDVLQDNCKRIIGKFPTQ